jgi:hypothetical protein
MPPPSSLRVRPVRHRPETRVAKVEAALLIGFENAGDLEADLDRRFAALKIASRDATSSNNLRK